MSKLDGSKMLLGMVDRDKKGFSEFMDFHLSEDIFRGDELELYRFLNAHALKYGQLPKRKTIKDWAATNPISIPSKEAVDEPPKFYLDQIENRNLKLNLKSAMMGAEKLRVESPDKALEALTSEILRLNQKSRRKNLINFTDDAPKMLHEEYVQAHLNVDKGLKFGWDTFDEMSGGLTGGDVVTIVGRPGMGKTYIMLHAMIHAWHQGLTTLFVSMEMKNVPVVQRVAALATNTSISELKSGQISTSKYERMHTIIKGMSGAQGMWIADGALSATTDDLQILCSQLQPDVVFIDGAYLLRHKNDRIARHEKVNQNQEDIKQHIAEGRNITVVQSFQFNREMVKKDVEDVGVENIGGSDAVGQLSSVVMGLFEEDSIETVLQRKIRILKGRNGEQGEFMINWRFGGFGKKQSDDDKDVSDIMNFTEIPKDKIDTEMKFT